MKKIFYLLMFILSSCMQQPTINDEVEAPRLSPLTKIWIDYANNNKEIFNNEVSRENASILVQDMMLDSIKNNPSLLRDEQIRFEMVYRLSSNKYIAKFHLSDTRYYCTYSNDFKVTGNIISIVDESYAITLKDNAYYRIRDYKFEGNVNAKNIKLRDGNYLYYLPAVNEYFSCYSFSLGGIYLSELQLELDTNE